MTHHSPFTWLHYTGHIEVSGQYVDTDATALTFVDDDQEPITTLTVNLVDHFQPQPGCVFIKNYSENEGIAGALALAHHATIESMFRIINNCSVWEMRLQGALKRAHDLAREVAGVTTPL